MDIPLRKSGMRTRNFTMRERRILLRLIKKYANIIENKRIDSATKQQKYQAWSRIETEFNRSVLDKRSMTHLKRCYKNMRLRAMKDKSWENSSDIVKMVESSKNFNSTVEKEINVPLLSIIANSMANFDEVKNDNDVIKRDSEDRHLAFEFTEEEASNVDEPVYHMDEPVDKTQEYHNMQMSLLIEKHRFEMSLAKEKHELELQFAREKHLKEIELLDLKLSLTRRALI